ncbi:hypothetical protein GW17_00016330 [Ensete ventricosum]|nr:hypothetical protein GW17_00016330 [Ensete ventricosum]
MPRRSDELTVAAVGGNLHYIAISKDMRKLGERKEEEWRRKRESLPFEVIEDDSIRDDLTEARHRIQLRAQLCKQFKTPRIAIRTRKEKQRRGIDSYRNRQPKKNRRRKRRSSGTLIGGRNCACSPPVRRRGGGSIGERERGVRGSENELRDWRGKKQAAATKKEERRPFPSFPVLVGGPVR